LLAQGNRTWQQILADYGHWLGIALGIAGVLAANVRTQPWTLDDAYITFRYAENLAAGHGLVYNPGEYVEGTTTLLWAVILAAVHAIGLDTILASKTLGFMLAVATVLLAGHAHTFVQGLSRNGSALAAALIGAWIPFGAWCQTGMEVPLAGFLGLLAFLLYLRWQNDAGNPALGSATAIVCALAMFSRPESGLVFGAMFLDGVFRAPKLGLRRMLPFVGVFCAALVLITAWRLYYYGDYVPNTFHAKVGATEAQILRGLGYLEHFAMSSIAALFLVVAGIVFSGGAPRVRSASAVLGLFLVLHTAYVISVGGDVMPAYRFFATVVPMAALLGGITLHVHAGAGWRAWIVVAIIGGHAAYELQHNKTYAIHDAVAHYGRLTGLFMKDHYPPDTLIATNTAGTIPYFSGLPTIDTLGLCDRTIGRTHMPTMGKNQAGHEKANGKYVLSRKPDVVILGSSRGQVKPRFRSDKELVAQPGFKKEYFRKDFKLDGYTLIVYQRKDTFKEEYSALQSKSKADKE